MTKQISSKENSLRQHRIIKDEHFQKNQAISATYAKRWAAKEACSKALGTGLRMGISWKDMGVNNLKSGQPQMKLTG